MCVRFFLIKFDVFVGFFVKLCLVNFVYLEKWLNDIKFLFFIMLC